MVWVSLGIDAFVILLVLLYIFVFRPRSRGVVNLVDNGLYFVANDVYVDDAGVPRGILDEDLRQPHDAAACGLLAEYACAGCVCGGRPVLRRAERRAQAV